MTQHTYLHDRHRALGGKLVDFHGWALPLHYGSQLQEHRVVRNSAGMFDVSHMGVVDVTGTSAREYLRTLLANDVNKIDGSRGKALYSVMLNRQGGVIDDLIVYSLDTPETEVVGYRLVLNSANQQRDLLWMTDLAEHYDVELQPVNDHSLIAVQGPEAVDKAASVLPTLTEIANLKPFHALTAESLFVARTGYTGEDGVEILVPNSQVETLWNTLLDCDVQPCGLGARDTLRLEAGLNLHGNEMDENTSPLIANLSWTVAWQPKDRDFVGRSALETQEEEGVKQKLVGLLLNERGVLRSQQKVFDEAAQPLGVITSGTFSPTLGKSIALARVDVGVGTHCSVELRNKTVRVDVVSPRFVRNGQVLV